LRGPLSPSLGPANWPPRAGLSSFPLLCGPRLPVSPTGGSLWPGLRLLRATRSVARMLTGRPGIRGPLGRLIPRPSRHKEPCGDLLVAHAPSPIFSPRTKAPQLLSCDRSWGAARAGCTSLGAGRGHLTPLIRKADREPGRSRSFWYMRAGQRGGTRRFSVPHRGNFGRGITARH
jgi:hypothetical protein